MVKGLNRPRRSGAAHKRANGLMARICTISHSWIGRLRLRLRRDTEAGILLNEHIAENGPNVGRRRLTEDVAKFPDPDLPQSDISASHAKFKCDTLPFEKATFCQSSVKFQATRAGAVCETGAETENTDHRRLGLLRALREAKPPRLRAPQ
jgi:hypothetical protein